MCGPAFVFVKSLSHFKSSTEIEDHATGAKTRSNVYVAMTISIHTSSGVKDQGRVEATAAQKQQQQQRGPSVHMATSPPFSLYIPVPRKNPRNRGRNGVWSCLVWGKKADERKRINEKNINTTRQRQTETFT